VRWIHGAAVQVVVEVDGLTHGYNGRMLFEDANLSIEKGERIAIIGPNGWAGGRAPHLLRRHLLPEQGAACALASARSVVACLCSSGLCLMDGTSMTSLLVAPWCACAGRGRARCCA